MKINQAKLHLIADKRSDIWLYKNRINWCVTSGCSSGWYGCWAGSSWRQSRIKSWYRIGTDLLTAKKPKYVVTSWTYKKDATWTSIPLIQVIQVFFY